MVRISEKRKAINKIFKDLRDASPDSNVLEFDNNKVKEVTGTLFRNQFDATKFDSYKALPNLLKENGFFIVHLGKGRHAFVKGEGFHKFEKIKEIIDWDLSTKSYIDKISQSEAQSASTAFNDQIVHDFIFGDIKKDVLVHTARRARVSYNFNINKTSLRADTLQIEIDGLFESKDTIATVEVKNVEHEDFEIRQLFSAMKYFEMLKEKKEIPENVKIRHLFMIRIRKKDKNYFKVYEYKFTDKEDPNSIKFVKCKRYNTV